MVGLFVHTATPQSPPKIRSFTSANFYLPISPPLYLFTKPSLRFSPILPSSNSAVFKLQLFTNSHSCNLFQKLFPYHNHLANSGCIKWPSPKRFLWGLTLYILPKLPSTHMFRNSPILIYNLESHQTRR